jgi:hypothetical protein
MDRQQARPIFVMGRQHSGNTMLATVLERSPAVFCLKGEGAFFEHHGPADQLAPRERGQRVSELIQAGGLSKEDVGALNAALRAEVEAPGGPAPSAQSLYARGMAHLASQHGATRWAQRRPPTSFT